MEANFYNAARQWVLDKDPHIFDVDLAKIDANAKERREFFDKANVQKTEPQIELNKLRGQLFSLQEQVKNTEIYANEKAGCVELLEKRVAGVMLEKKRYGAMNNLLAERRCELSLQRLEGELADANKEYTFAKHRSAQATRALRAFDGAARIIELREQLEPKPLPDAKTNV